MNSVPGKTFSVVWATAISNVDVFYSRNLVLIINSPTYVVLDCLFLRGTIPEEMPLDTYVGLFQVQ